MIDQSQIPLADPRREHQPLLNSTKSLLFSERVSTRQAVGQEYLGTGCLMVRERVTQAEPVGECPERLKRLAHPSNPLVAQLNDRWRVVDDPPQWTLQKRKGNPRNKNSGWSHRSHCRTKEGLLQCVREYCSNVDPSALSKLASLPDFHGMQNLDVLETDQVPGENGSMRSSPETFEVRDADR